MAVAAPSRSTGLDRTVQSSFAGGMYRSGAPELMPADAMYDATNCLLDHLGGVFKRGGSVYRSSAGFGAAGLRWIWDGTLAKGGQQTLVANASEYGRLKGVGEGFTALGHGGQSSPLKVAVYEGTLYFPGGNTFDGETWGTAAKVAAHYAVVANRLVAAEGDKVWFSNIGKPGTFTATDFHVIPGGVTILGLEPGRDSCVVFTTGGVWVISNMALNLTDAAGNVQQRLDRFSADLILWGASGLAGWEGNLLVPGTDALWLVNRGVSSEVVRSFSRLSDPIRDLYREYVKLGYSPGKAAVSENHYLLPIIGGGKVADLLVCRLDMAVRPGRSPGAWTRFAGAGSQMGALATRTGSGTSREPELIGAQYGTGSRVLTCSYFNPSPTTMTDADASIPEWALETRSYITGSLTPNLVARLRASYVCWAETSSPKIALRVALDSPTAGSIIWGLFVWGVGKWASPTLGNYEALAGEAPPSVDGAKAYSWRLHKKRRLIRFRLICTQAVAELELKSLELFVRAGGRL